MKKSLLFEDGQVVELRCLGTDKGTWSGYYNDLAQMAKDAKGMSGKAECISLTLNPVHPDLLFRATNRLKPFIKENFTTNKTDILYRRWLFIDLDSKRVPGIAATDEEHDTALSQAMICRQWLTEQGWPLPVFSDSGNGGHLLYRIDLPNDKEAETMISTILKVLAIYQNTDMVTVDIGVHDANRIWRCPGTLNCKGDNSTMRPHRLAQILEHPEVIEPVPTELLMRLADLLPKEPARSYGGQRSNNSAPFNIDLWLEKSGLQVLGESHWDGSGKKWTLNPCPFNAAHTNKSAALFQFASGAMYFKCFHNGCAGNGWEELRELVEPGWRSNRSAPLSVNGHRADHANTEPPPPEEQEPPPRPSTDTGANDNPLSADQIKSPRELAQAYSAYAQKLQSVKIELGWAEVDRTLRGIAPGEVLTVIAKTGVGKTALLQNILRHLGKKRNSASLFCSMEQPNHQVFERYAQMGMEVNGEEIEKNWLGSETTRQGIIEQLTDDLGEWTLTCDLPGLTLAQIEYAAALSQEKIGRKINLLALDYLSLIDGHDLDRSLYGQTSKIARYLKNMAKKLDLAIVLLCQVARTSGEDGHLPLTINSARESGAIEEAADFLLGIYRPGMGGPQDDRIAIQILKNRKGNAGATHFYGFNKRTLVIGTQALSNAIEPPETENYYEPSKNGYPHHVPALPVPQPSGGEVGQLL